MSTKFLTKDLYILGIKKKERKTAQGDLLRDLNLSLENYINRSRRNELFTVGNYHSDDILILAITLDQDMEGKKTQTLVRNKPLA